LKSLKAQSNVLAQTDRQLAILEGELFQGELPTFKSKTTQFGEPVMRPNDLEILQINMGYMCNQVCKHCHVDAGPDRNEIMSQSHLQKCLDILQKQNIPTVDLTGGAPEMNPNFRWFVEEAYKVGVEEIIVRSNLTIILANKKFKDLPKFFKKYKVHLVSSLPFYEKKRTDAQRGEGVFDKSIQALKMLNEVGYGKAGSALQLDLVYNPVGAFLPGNQAELEAEYKRKLKADFDIDFNALFTITNLPISRFLDYLLASDNYEDYMEKLVEAFNPAALDGLMCKNTLSVDWDGYLYDCDFNQMLALKVDAPKSQHIDNFDLNALSQREIITNQHCYGCTAGAGSSCQGSLV
jgi:radical SAM/Cys-rich protein